MEVGGAEMVAPVEGPGSLPLPLRSQYRRSHVEHQ